MTQYSPNDISTMFMLIMFVLAILSIDRGLPGGFLKPKGMIILGWFCMAVGVFVALCNKMGW